LVSVFSKDVAEVIATQKKQELRRYFTTSPLVARIAWEDTGPSILIKNSAPIKTLDRVTD
jgi:hypothetical protein